PTTPGGELTAKKTPGCKEAAATIAMTATKPSRSMEPYPIGHAWDSFVINFGVVPEEISEWKPEIAPQAMVMKQNGNTFPAKMGPVPSMNLVSGGSASCGCVTTIPPASRNITPSLIKVLR